MIPATLGCSRHLRRLLTPAIRRAARTPGADRYRKHFPASAHLWLLVLHGLGVSPSLRQTYALLVTVPGLSFSQLARSSTSRPAACVETRLAELVGLARRHVAPDPAGRLLRKVQALDSTFLRLSLQFSPWSQHGRHRPGVRVHYTLDVARHVPRSLRLTLVDTNDHATLTTWELEALRGWTVLVDLGYYGHRQFARLRAAGVSFLSRLHQQAAYRVTAARAVVPKTTRDGDVVLADETITLGSPNNRRGAVLPDVRLITSRNRHG